jgi:alkylation response protein AidB-like acyl-CoA dehydrogenase
VDDVDFSLSPIDKMTIRSAEDFVRREILTETVRRGPHGKFSDVLARRFGEARLLGLTVPAVYGGSGASHLSSVLVAEELGRAGSESFWLFSMMNTIAESIAHWGTEEIKQKYLPMLCRGEATASTAFTEEATGSVPGLLESTAVQKNGDLVINGRKRFIMFGDQPGVALFYVRDLTRTGHATDTTALIVEKLSPGYSATGPRKLMGLDGISVTDIDFEDVCVPFENILGLRGRGFGILLRWIAVEKILQASFMVGMGQKALDLSREAAKEKKDEGRPLGAQQGIQWMLAEMKAKIDACRLMVRKAGWHLDNGEDYDILSAEAKLFTVPLVQEVIRRAVRILGEGALVKDSDLERIYRNAMHGGIVATSTEVNKTIAGMALIR